MLSDKGKNFGNFDLPAWVSCQFVHIFIGPLRSCVDVDSLDHWYCPSDSSRDYSDHTSHSSCSDLSDCSDRDDRYSRSYEQFDLAVSTAIICIVGTFQTGDTTAMIVPALLTSSIGIFTTVVTTVGVS